MKRLRGVRWLSGRIRDCRCEPWLLTSLKRSRPVLSALIRRAGLHVVRVSGYQFDKGYTCVWLLKQSHVSVHSWPEHGFVTLTIEVCDFKGDPPGRAGRLRRLLLKLFCPARSSRR